MDPIVAVRPDESVRRDPAQAPDRAQIRETIMGRARDLSATWRAAWREAWREQEPTGQAPGRRA